MKESGLPSVITIAPYGQNIMRDGVSILDTCKELEQQGGDVVGMNCHRGPNTMLPYLKEIKNRKCHVGDCPLLIEQLKLILLFLIYRIIMDAVVLLLMKLLFPRP